MADGLMDHGTPCLAGEDHRHPAHGRLPGAQHQQGSVGGDIGHLFRGIYLEELESDAPAHGLIAGLRYSILDGDHLDEKEGSNPIVLNQDAF